MRGRLVAQTPAIRGTQPSDLPTMVDTQTRLAVSIRRGSLSSVAAAGAALQAEGHRFDPGTLHVFKREALGFPLQNPPPTGVRATAAGLDQGRAASGRRNVRPDCESGRGSVWGLGAKLSSASDAHVLAVRAFSQPSQGRLIVRGDPASVPRDKEVGR